MKAFLSALPMLEESMYIRWWWKQVKWVPVDKASLTQSWRRALCKIRAFDIYNETWTHDAGVVGCPAYIAGFSNKPRAAMTPATPVA